MMYKRHLNQINLLDAPEYFDGIALDPENEWVKLEKLIPWYRFEEEYAASFPSGTGQPACSFRIALGSLLIKERYPAFLMTAYNAYIQKTKNHGLIRGKRK